MNTSTPEAARANLELHIERVVLDGLPILLRERAAIGAALETELWRLLAESGWGADVASVALPSLRAEGIQWSATGGVDQLGVQIAQAVYGSLTGSVVGPA